MAVEWSQALLDSHEICLVTERVRVFLSVTRPLLPRYLYPEHGSHGRGNLCRPELQPAVTCCPGPGQTGHTNKRQGAAYLQFSSDPQRVETLHNDRSQFLQHF